MPIFIEVEEVNPNNKITFSLIKLFEEDSNNIEVKSIIHCEGKVLQKRLIDSY